MDSKIYSEHSRDFLEEGTFVMDLEVCIGVF